MGPGVVLVPGLAWLDNTHRETSKKPRSYLATPDQAILNRLACDLISLSLSLSLTHTHTHTRAHVALVQNGNTLVAYMDGKKSDMIRMNSNQVRVKGVRARVWV